MSTTTATKCDRCGLEELGTPTGWGVVKLFRAKPFLETGALDLCMACFRAAYTVIRVNTPDGPLPPPPAIREDLVMVHADGGKCHGTRLVNNQCPRCGIVPDMQSTELWPVLEAK